MSDLRKGLPFLAPYIRSSRHDGYYLDNVEVLDD